MAREMRALLKELAEERGTFTELRFVRKTTRDEVTVIIRDEGPGFDPNSIPDPTDPANLENVSGRGLLLINAFMDEVTHNEVGNQITMIKRKCTGESGPD